MLHEEQSPRGRDGGEPDIGRIYREVSPSVAAMKLEKADGHSRHRRSNLDDPRASFGSAFIYDSQRGLIVTNWHVARSQKELAVKIGNQTIEVKLRGVDESLDLALLEVKDKAILPPAVKRGDPQKLEVGDPVYAIGSPFGFDGTLSRGIISGPPRSIKFSERPMVKLIQHDAAVNPGNSGGVLLNRAGEVVGMNTGILSRSGGFQGFAIAVPIDLIERSVNDLLRTGKVTQPSIGFVTSSTEHGLAVIHVRPGSVAYREGIASEVDFGRWSGKPDFRQTLFLTGVNGSSVTEESELAAALARQRGQPITLQLRKGIAGKVFEVLVKPDEVDVPDAVAIDECLQSRAKLLLEPSCEHIRVLSEHKPLTPTDVRGLLTSIPFVLVISRPEPSGIFRRIRADEPGKATVYVERFGALAKLLEFGKGIAWLEGELAKIGFNKVASSESLKYERAVSQEEAISIVGELSRIVHGQDQSSGELQSILRIPGLPRGLLDLLRQGSAGS